MATKTKSKSSGSKKERSPILEVGARVRITKGDFKGVSGAIVGVTYKDTEQRAIRQIGDPADVRFLEVDEYHVITRGQRQHVWVKPNEVEKARVAEVNRGSLK